MDAYLAPASIQLCHLHTLYNIKVDSFFKYKCLNLSGPIQKRWVNKCLLQHLWMSDWKNCESDIILFMSFGDVKFCLLKKVLNSLQRERNLLKPINRPFRIRSSICNT